MPYSLLCFCLFIAGMHYFSMLNSPLILKDSRFRLVVFEDEAILFDCLSGDSHYLSPLAYARLQGVSEADITSRIQGSGELGLQESLKAIDAQLRDWDLAV